MRNEDSRRTSFCWITCSPVRRQDPSHAHVAYSDSYYLAFQLLELWLANAAWKDLKRDGFCLDLAAKMFFTSRRR